jgi:hypothetical protein
MKITFHCHSNKRGWTTYKVQVLLFGFVVKTQYFTVGPHFDTSAVPDEDIIKSATVSITT